MFEKHFHIRWRKGIFPTFPMLSVLTVIRPSHVIGLHRLYNRLLAYPNWCFLNVFLLEKPEELLDPMKILLINSEYPPIGGGAGNASSNIARVLA